MRYNCANRGFVRCLRPCPLHTATRSLTVRTRRCPYPGQCQCQCQCHCRGGGSVNGQAAIDAIGLTGATLPSGLTTDAVSVNYFANVGSTRTQGLDIMADYTVRLHRYGNLALSMGLNLNRTRVNHINTTAQGLPRSHR